MYRNLYDHSFFAVAPLRATDSAAGASHQQ
jgi:hypothetical protein